MHCNWWRSLTETSFIKFFNFLDFYRMYIFSFARSCPSSFFITVLNSLLEAWTVNPFGSFWRRSISVGSEHFNLLYISYIQEQLKKACAKAAALRKLFKFIPQDVMIRLYKAYALPHLEYCSPLLLRISNGLKNKLEDTNYYILRTMLRYWSSMCNRIFSLT